MDTTSKICPVCDRQLPTNSTRRRVYCSDTCRYKAKWRRAKNAPIANLPATADELRTLTNQLADARATISKLQKQLATARAKNRAIESQLQSLENSSAAHLAKTYQIAQQENQQLHATNEHLANTLTQLRQETATATQLREAVAGADRYAQKLRDAYRKLYRRWFRQATHLHITARDALFYAAYYYRATDRTSWSHEDYDRHARYKELKAHPPARPSRKDSEK